MILLEEILQKVVGFLPQVDIKQARLVCQEWNLAVVGSCSCWKLAYTLSDSSRPVPLPPLQFNRSEPRIFRHLAIKQDDDPDAFLASFGYNDWVQSVRITFDRVETLESLILAAHHGLLPNLKNLSITITHPGAEDILRNKDRLQFPPVILPKLRFLKITSTTNKLKDQAFLQALIDAAPNLCSLESLGTFNLSSLARLETLNNNRFRDYNSADFENMLRSIRNFLQELRISSVYDHFLYGRVSWPKIPSLKRLYLSGYGVVLPKLFCEMQNLFPNLTDLSLPNAPFRPPSILSDVLENQKFPTLKKFKMHWRTIREDNQPWINRLQHFISSNEELKVVKLQLEMEHDSWIATEEFFQTCNLRVSALILELSHFCTMTLLLRFLGRVKVKSINEQINRNAMLEIRNDSKKDPYDYKDADSEEGLESFVSIMQNLLKRFKFIRLKSFQVSSEFLGKLMESIQTNQLNVGIYCKPCTQA